MCFKNKGGKVSKQKRKSKKNNKYYNEKRKNLKKLKELKKEISVLESQLKEAKKTKVKQFHIRNLKVFANTCNFIAPFVVCSGLTVGLFALFGGGTPIRVDEVTKYKTYNMEYQTNGVINIDEEYKTSRWFDDPLPSNVLTIFTQWELQDNQYVRYKREYKMGTLTTLDLYNAVLEENYDYINNNLKDYDEEKQIINKIYMNEENNYKMKASLHIMNKDDFLKYDETMMKNIVISIIEVILGLGLGSLIAKNRDFDFLYEVKGNNYDYKKYTSVVENTELALEVANKKLLYLGGKHYER